MGYAQPDGFPGHWPMPGGPASHPWAQDTYGGRFTPYWNPAVVSCLCSFFFFWMCVVPVSFYLLSFFAQSHQAAAAAQAQPIAADAGKRQNDSCMNISH